jgi:hypothetical protein
MDMKWFSSLLERNLVTQVGNIEKLFSRHKTHPITRAQLDEAESTRPQWPKTDQPVVVVLVPYFAPYAMYNATGNTIRADWRGADCMIDPSAKNYRSPEVIREGRIMENFRLIDGLAPPMGLRWEVINLFHDRNVAVKDLRGPKISPHAGVIAVGIHFPKLAMALGRDEVPNLAIPGYVRTFDAKQEPHVLVMGRPLPDFKNPTLFLQPESAKSESVAVPTFFRAA